MVGVGVGESLGWPKTSPVLAAAMTVPVPTSYQNGRCMSATTLNVATFCPKHLRSWRIQTHTHACASSYYKSELHTTVTTTYTWDRLHLDVLQIIWMSRSRNEGARMKKFGCYSRSWFASS